MADDSRDTSSLQEAGDIPRSFNANPDSKKTKREPASSQTGKLWDAFGNPEEPANALAKATYKPPGKDPKDASYSEIIGSVSLSELSTVHKRPCARESLMTGIGVGFGIGGLRGVLKGIVLCFVVLIKVVTLIRACRTLLFMVCRQLGCRHVRNLLIGSI
jgi:cytochrome c oxidase assembly protein subunit 20